MRACGETEGGADDNSHSQTMRACAETEGGAGDSSHSQTLRACGDGRFQKVNVQGPGSPARMAFAPVKVLEFPQVPTKSQCR